MAETTIQRLNPERDESLRAGKIKYNESYDEFPLLLNNQPERSKREDRYIGGYFPPPWNCYEHPEKTQGWIAFQEEQRKDPNYYGCGALNS